MFFETYANLREGKKSHDSHPIINECGGGQAVPGPGEDSP
jgi:hypothetical protein